jgi:hypothetical protein
MKFKKRINNLIEKQQFHYLKMLPDTILDVVSSMVKNLGTKITCPKCKTKFYSLGKRKPFCPTCQQNNLIPDGEIVNVKLKIRPGGFNDPKFGWTNGLASKGKTGAIYLNCEFTVEEGKHTGKKVFSLIGLHSPKGPWWGDKGRALIRGILDSTNGVPSGDCSPSAVRQRRLKSLMDLDGVTFFAKIDNIKGDDGRRKNELGYAVDTEQQDTGDKSTEKTDAPIIETDEQLNANDLRSSKIENQKVIPMWMS